MTDHSLNHFDDEFDDEDSELDDRVVSATKHYMSMLESGNAPSTEEFLRQHSDIADQLRPSLEGLALIHRAAEPKPVGTAIAPDKEFTLKPIGDFQIVGELGRGGMGVVYEAIQLSLGRKVALKVLPFASGLDEIRLQRFRNEAHAAAALHHTNIVPVYAVGSDRGIHFYAMQLIQGQTLADVIHEMRRANGKAETAAPQASVAATLTTASAPSQSAEREKGTSQSTAAFNSMSTAVSTVLNSSVSERTRYYRRMVKMIHQAALAIQHAHQYGVIHRDIKPGNLLLDTAGQIWVTDFGLAQIQHAESNMTRTGDPMGTLKYMSPEQASGNREMMDHRTDVYSLGVTLYELLTLEPAIKGDGYRTMLNQVAEHEPPPPKSIDPLLPIELDTIIRKAISKSPSDRFQSAQSFADDLQSWLDDKPIAAKPPSVLERLAKWRRRNSGLVATASVLLMAATIGLLVTTVVIYRALDRETEQRELAEASFRQAKSAVEQFSNLSESELAYRPDLQDLRRSFLETSLGFYQEFVNRQSDDPAIQLELAATSDRVQTMVEELRLLDKIEPMLMLSSKTVQEDIGIDEDTAATVMEAVEIFQTKRESLAVRYVGSLQSGNSEISGLLQTFETEMSQYLSPAQFNRLRQIGRQQRLPFVFKSLEVADQLGLTPDQRETINRIIEETRPNRGSVGRQGNFSFESKGGMGASGGFGFGPSPERNGGGFPPGGFGGGGRPPQKPGGPDFHGPDFRGGGFEMARSEVTRNTVQHILEALTPEQCEQWKSLIGEPFQP